MELYFCSQCGISIPLAQVESGDAAGPDEKYFCTEHRPEQEAPAAPAGEAVQGLEDIDLELLFCSNCRVSIPITDARSGRARKQYGSLLCAVCSRADPGERAARREAVEAEMAADVQQNDPLASMQRTAAPPLVDRPMSPPPTQQPSSGSLPLYLLVFTAIFLAGVSLGRDLLREEPAPPKDYGSDVAQLETTLQTLRNQVDDRDAEVRKLRDDLAIALGDAGKGVEARLGDRIGALQADVEGLSQGTDTKLRRLGERVSRSEGELAQLTERVRALTENAGARADPGPGNGGGDSGTDVSDAPADEPEGGGDGPIVRPPDPKVVQLCKDLLDPGQDDSVRFPAATELGRVGDETAIPALARALIADKHFLVRRAAARSLGNLKAWNGVPALVQALQDKEAYVAQQASFALQTITGQDFGVTQDQAPGERKRRARQAGKWWETNRENPPDGVSLHTAEL